jgi:ribosomal protein S18 acetylase RimI-like enzyme
MVRIIRADASHIGQIAPLFDSYRQFYDQSPDLERATTYLKARLDADEAVIFLALGDDGEALGFTQLYPTFCSVEARNAYILYDLFVSDQARRRGVASLLLNAARQLGENQGAAWLRLETDVSNLPAQALYEKHNWERDTEYYTYFLQFRC